MSLPDSSLLNAVLNNDINEVKKALLKGDNVNILSGNGISLLGRAIQIGNNEVIEMLINAEHFSSSDDIEDAPNNSQNFDFESLRKITTGQLKESSSYVPDKFGVCAELKKMSLNVYDSTAPVGLHLFDTLRRSSVPSRHCHVNLVDYHDRTPIHYAAECGNCFALEKLTSAGARVNSSDRENVTPLHLAVTFEHIACVKMLLKAGCRVNCKTSDKSSALHIACSRGYFSIVELLVKNDASLEILDSSERTPLFIATMKSRFDIVQLLLCAGAKVNVAEIHGYTPLYEAVCKKNTPLVELLLKFGAKAFADQNLLQCAIRNNTDAILELLLMYGAPLASRDEFGDAPIHTAIRMKNIQMLSLLIEYGASSVRNDKNGAYPLHIAVSVIPETDFKTFSDILYLLLECGTNLDSNSGGSRNTALHESIALNKFVFSEELIRQGSDPNLGEVYSCNIDNLGLAARKGNLHLVKLLIYSGFLISHIESSLKYLSIHRELLHDIYDFLVTFQSKPMSLAQLSRLVIRRSLGQNIAYKVSKLTLPFTLYDYLLLKDNC